MALPAILGALAGSGGGAAAGTTAAAGMDVMGLVGSIQFLKSTLTGAVPSITAATSKFSRAINYIPETILGVAAQIQDAAAKWGAALYAPIDTLKAIGAQATRGVARVNPATVQQFNIALEDAEGVIGRQLLPVLVRWTKATRDFADYLVKIEPITSRLGNVAIRLIDIAERLGKTIGDDLAFVLDQMIPLIETQVKWWEKLAKAMDFAMKFSILGQLVKRSGLDQPGGSSVGASIRQVRYMGSEEIQQEVARQSLIASMAKTKEEQAQEAAISSASLLQMIWDFMRTQWTKDAFKQRVGGMAEGAAGGLAGGNPNQQVDAMALARSLAMGALGGGF